MNSAMRATSRLAVAVACLLAAAATLWAQDEELPPAAPPPVEFEMLGLTAFGAQVRFRFNEISPLDEARLSPVLELGGGYFQQPLFRDAFGDEWVPPLDFSGTSPAYYQVWDIKAGAGLYARLKESFDGANVGAFAVYRFEYSEADPSKSASSTAWAEGLGELSGLFRHGLTLGARVSDVDVRALNQVRQGYAAELSVSGGIADVPSLGESGVWGKASAHAEWYLSLASLPSFGMYLAGRLAGDYVAGSFVPTMEMQSVGGYNQITALGGGLRGTAPGRFDGNFRAMHNLDLRMSFPALFGYYVFPGIVLYADLGVSDCRTDDPFASGVQAAAGGGLWLHVVYVDFVFLYAYHVNESRPSFGFSFGLPF